MTDLLKNAVQDKTTTGGTGSLVMAGVAPQARRTVGQALSNGQSATFRFEDTVSGAWEHRSGCVWTSATNTLSRGTLLDSSTGSAINFTPGVNVSVVLIQDASQVVTATGFTMVGAFGLAASASVSSATTTAIGAADSNRVTITGTVTITAFDSAADGVWRYVRFAGALTLTHNATSLILPSGANITTAAGDCALFISEGSGNWRCLFYTPANGQPLFVAAATIASASTTDLGSSNAQAITISGTTTITAFGSSAPTGMVKFIQFSGALTLTHNGTSLIVPGALNIATAAGDTAIVRHEGSGNWRVLSYTRANGHPLTTAAATIASASTTNLGSTLAQSITVSGTTTITSFGSSAPTGAVKDIYFSGALQITHNATSMINIGGANITTVAGDCCSVRHEGSGNWRMLNYSRGASLPSFSTPAGVTLATLTPSSAAAATDTTSLTSTYKFYEIKFANLVPASDGDALLFRCTQSATAKSDSQYKYSLAYSTSASTTLTGVNGSGATSIRITPASAVNNITGNGGVSGSIFIHNPANGSSKKNILFGSGCMNASGNMLYSNGGGFYDANATAWDGFSLFFESGNISSGTIKVIGYV